MHFDIWGTGSSYTQYTLVDNHHIYGLPNPVWVGIGIIISGIQLLPSYPFILTYKLLRGYFNHYIIVNISAVTFFS